MVIPQPFDPETLHAWGAVALEQPATDGARNTVWFGRLNGRRCVVRRTRRTTAALDWELDVVDAVRGSGLGAPAIVRTTNGERFRGGVVIHEYIDGHPPRSRDDWLAVARYLTALHSAFHDIPQRPGFLSALDLLSAEQGGDVDLTAMPADAVRRCRAAWARLSDYPKTLVHGDPGASNIRIGDTGVVLIDWDESRVDVPLFDLAALPSGVAPLGEHEYWIASQAASAWEAAVGWRVEPDYARKRLTELET